MIDMDGRPGNGYDFGIQLIAMAMDAFRYRWLREAGAWESEIGMDELSKDPKAFDAAVDRAIELRKSGYGNRTQD